MGEEKKLNIRIGQVKDVNNRQVFSNHVLCAQFLRDYADLDILKNVQPEDIEDVTDKYQAYLGIEFETDTVKKIHLPEMQKDMPLYMVSLIEHKSDVDYNVCMQLLRYTVCIWDDYAKTMEKAHPGISKTKGFRYPPVFPIVYYEGTGKWTAAMHVKERVFMKMQVSVSEATDCLRKMIGGESMGNWFENMEPMNIQEERANTKRERERADQTEEERDRAEAKLGKTEVERDKAEKTLMALMKKVYGTKENVIKNLVDSYDKSEEEAEHLIQKYW